MKAIKKQIALTLCLDALLVALACAVKPIGRLMIDGISDCLITKYGLVCPSCGGTRSVISFFSGKFSDAWNYNQFFVLLIIYAFVLVIALNLAFLFDITPAKKLLRFMVNPKTVIAIAIAFAVFGIARNFV